MQCSTFFGLALTLLLIVAHTDGALSTASVQWLNDLYDDLDGPSWTNSAGWKSANDPCGTDTIDPWFGITCNNDNDLVSRIDLPDNKLSGVLPANNLPNLGRLDLSENAITGVPSDWSSYSTLRVLFLDKNAITDIPSSWAGLDQIRQLRLDFNDITNIPLVWTGLETARGINLRANNINTIPPSWVDGEGDAVLPLLLSLNLQDNEITTIPSSWEGLEGIESINFDGNQITTIPDSWVPLQGILRIVLSENLITDLPDLWDGLDAATQVTVFDNRISEIPPTWEDLDSVTLLDLSENFIEELPPTWAGLETVEDLLLDINRIRMIPSSWEGLTAVDRVILHRNQITAIPDSWAGLESATSVLLHLNDIRGTIPVGPVIPLLEVRLDFNEMCGALDASAMNTLIDADGADNRFDCESPPSWCPTCTCEPANAGCCPDEQFLVVMEGYTGGECAFFCPRGFFQTDETYGICTKCNDACETCFGPTVDECWTCKDSFFSQDDSCVGTCDKGTYGNGDRVCAPCPHECSECSSADICTECRDPFLLDGNDCVVNCPDGTFQMDGAEASTCEDCTGDCETCSSASVCESCVTSDPVKYLNHADGTCNTTCAPGTYADEANKQCLPCSARCDTCDGPSRNCD